MRHSQILQSSAWARIQKTEGKEVEIYGFVHEGSLRAAWIMIKNELPLGMKYFYSPRIDFSHLDLDEVKYIARELELMAGRSGMVFWRFDPMEYFAIDDKRPVPTISIQAQQSLYLDLDMSEEELLGQMHQKTRYNIRLALKKGVQIRPAQTGDFEKWWPLMEATVKRDAFRRHSRRHYEILLNEAAQNIDLWVAEFEGQIICGNIMAWYGDMATYLHGASGNEHRNIMAPYALQWALIKEAKQRGFRYYDFNGINGQKWPGVTRFKRGFGGRIVNFPGTFDLVFNEGWYKGYKLLRGIRRGIAGRGR